MGMDQTIRRKNLVDVDDYTRHSDGYEFTMRNEKHINNWFSKNVHEIESGEYNPISIEILEDLVNDIHTVLKAFGVSEKYGNEVAKRLFVKNHYGDDFDRDFVSYTFSQNLDGVQKMINQAYVDIALGMDIHLEYYADW